MPPGKSKPPPSRNVLRETAITGGGRLVTVLVLSCGHVQRNGYDETRTDAMGGQTVPCWVCWRRHERKRKRNRGG